MPDDLRHRSTVLVRSTPLAEPVPDPAPGTARLGDVTDKLLRTSAWTDELVARAGIPVVDVPFVTVGGGIGSFTIVDTLRIGGVPIEQIAVLTNLETPWQTYEYLTRVSQIPRHERLRSDSSGMPDCIWGFPSYALREAWKERTIAPLMSVVAEPVLTDYWTPRAGTVFDAMAREARRVRYQEAVRRGQVRVVRRRHGGGYFAVHTPPPGTSPTRRVAYRSRYVHVAVGYPGLRFLPDLQDYRERTGDTTRVVNAYEPHEHVYAALAARGGTVVVRGGGIVASRVLQRLIDDRDRDGAPITIVHLLRTYVAGTHGDGPFRRRRGGNGFAYQGFNWPKGSWGGQLRSQLEQLEGEQRGALLRSLGGTTTASRKAWNRGIERATREGWLCTVQGQVEAVVSGADGRVVTRVRTASMGAEPTEVRADYVIDATGLEADLREHRLLADLLDHGGAGRNPLGRLDVERTFEVRGTRAEPGRMYASGAMTLGGYYAPVDSFVGLQYAALRIADDLAAQGFGRRIGVRRSVAQWWRWVCNRPCD